MLTVRRFSKQRSVVAIASVIAAGSLVLTGCSGGQSGSTHSASTTKKVVMILGVSGDDGYLTDACGATIVAKKDNIDLTVQAANSFDPAAQTPVLQAAIATHPDAIIIAPTDAQAMIAPIQQAVAAGIKVILFDTTLNSLNGISSTVGVDNAAGGQLAAQTMSQLIGGSGKVMVTNINKGVSTTDARQQGFEDGIKKFPGIDYLGPQYNNDDASAAASQVSATLTAHPDLAGIFGTNLTEVEGSVTGLRNGGALGKVKIIGFDATPPEVTALENGQVQALIAQELRQEGETAMTVTASVLAGQSVQSHYDVGFRAVTKANLNTPASQEALYVAKCDA